MFDANEIIPQDNDWISLIFFTILIILVIVKIVFDDRLYQLSVLFFSKKYLSIYYNKEKTNVFNWFQFSLFFVQLLTISLFLSLLINYFQPNLGTLNYQLFIKISGGVLLYFGVRYLAGSFLGFIFDLKLVNRKIIFEKTSYFNGLTISLLPFLLFLVYSKHNQLIFLKISIFIVTLLLIWRYVLLLKINKKLIFSNLFYFILYLCTLEIAPLLIILKLTIYRQN